MTTYHAAAWIVPLDNGLTKRKIIKILSLLPENYDLVPFEIHEDHCSAYGYATSELVDEENGLDSIYDLLAPLVEDWTEDDSEYTGQLPGGKKVYIGCDYRTVRLQPTDEDEDEDGDVDGDDDAADYRA